MRLALTLLLLAFLGVPALGAEVLPGVVPEHMPINRDAASGSQASKKKTVPRPPRWVVQEAEVRSLPGWLDDVMVLNSNSPEIVEGDGILVSTFPAQGKRNPAAHLNLSLNGRFDIFAHHIARAGRSGLRTIYLGVLLQNPGTEPVKVSLLQSVSYLNKPDAPFVKLPAIVENPSGTVFAGPGDRTTDLILRGYTQAGWPREVTIAPGKSQMLFALPVPIRYSTPPVNGRSILARAQTTGKVYAACLAMRGRLDSAGRDRPPSLEEWQALLRDGSLATPRDRAPTHPKSTRNVIYGRVAGVSRGSTWRSYLRDDTHGRMRLNIAPPGKAFSYVLSTVEEGAFGTKNYQSAPLVVRYPDTAHEAHGNYGVRYELSLPLHNNLETAQRVTVSLQCPYKSNRPGHELVFRDPPMDRVFYRGTVRLRYRDDNGAERLRYVHLVQHQADASKPLVAVKLSPGETRMVMVDFIYPPDATPPQMLTVKTD